MPITIYERDKSRKAVLDPKGSTLSLDYCAKGSNDEIEILESIQAISPPFYDGLIRQRITADPQGGDFWYGTVEYGVPEGGELDGQGDSTDPPSQPEQPAETDHLGEEYSFDTAGGTQHITQSIITRSQTGRGALVAPDNKQAIGATKDKVEGCEILVPKLEFSITKKIPYITLKYVKTLRDLTGTVNIATFLGFAQGELLFLGASGQFRGQEGWAITYKFSAAKNETDITICTGLVVPIKRGWEYLWVGYAEQEDANVTIQQPSYAYVERVYFYEDFRQLGF